MKDSSDTFSLHGIFVPRKLRLPEKYEIFACDILYLLGSLIFFLGLFCTVHQIPNLLKQQEFSVILCILRKISMTPVHYPSSPPHSIFMPEHPVSLVSTDSSTSDDLPILSLIVSFFLYKTPFLIS